MRTELEDWKNGWFGVQLALTASEIDVLIARLQMIKGDPDQHFHLSSTYQGDGGLGDITIYQQAASEISNMESVGSSALAPGENITTSESDPSVAK